LNALSRELGLIESPVVWHVVRDSIAEVSSFLALVGGKLGEVTYDVRLFSAGPLPVHSLG
jgi:3-carboxy-cis,cis-muconate cycloisomerase